jgi:hypothetical protein
MMPNTLYIKMKNIMPVSTLYSVGSIMMLFRRSRIQNLKSDNLSDMNKVMSSKVMGYGEGAEGKYCET